MRSEKQDADDDACVGGNVQGISCDDNADCTGGGTCDSAGGSPLTAGTGFLLAGESLAYTQLPVEALRTNVDRELNDAMSRSPSPAPDPIRAAAEQCERLCLTAYRQLGDFERIIREHLGDVVSEAEGIERLRARMSELLTGVANALRGEPPPLVRWDWSRLPKEVGDVVAERGNLQDAKDEVQTHLISALAENARLRGERDELLARVTK
jgi:hypothetical protein